MNQDKRKSNSNFTRGGQITFHNLRMFFQVNTMLAKCFFLVMIGLVMLTTYISTPKNAFVTVGYTIRNQVLYKLNVDLDKSITTIWNGATYKSTF